VRLVGLRVFGSGVSSVVDDGVLDRERCHHADGIREASALVPKHQHFCEARRKRKGCKLPPQRRHLRVLSRVRLDCLSRFVDWA
jgi:hypothetical protein